jgi:soluble lytic murein transglycosylase
MMTKSPQKPMYLSMLVLAMLLASPIANAADHKKAHPHNNKKTSMVKKAAIAVPTLAVALTASAKERLALIPVLAEKNPAQAQQLAATFAGNPLEGYAQFLWLRPNLTDKNLAPNMSQYLTIFGDTSWAETIRQEWSAALLKQQDWTGLLQNQLFFTKDDARCSVLEAMQHDRNSVDDEWYDEVTQRWLTDSKPSTACGLVYDRLETSSKLSVEQWQQKLTLLYYQNKRDIITAKLSLLPTELQAETRETLSLLSANSIGSLSALIQNASKTTDPNLLVKEAQLFVRVMHQQVKKIPEEALPIWQEGKAVFHLHALVTDPIEKVLYAQLAKKQPERATEWIAQIAPSQQDETTLMPVIQQAWQTSNWSGLLSTIALLPSQTQEADMWQYWQARALTALSKDDDATNIYRSLATHRSFYGFLAADKLGVNYQLNAQQVSAEQLVNARQSALGKRLEALYEAGLKDVAWKEWNFARNTGHLTLSEMPGFAQAALGWGWNTFSALSMGYPAHWNYIDLRFSMPFQDIIHDNTQRESIPMAWAYGIMRRESVYSTDAKSRSGAMGLMQLMPKTAKALEPISNINNVYQPELNVHLGTKLLGQLKHDFNDNLVLATAAYNAGGFRVRQWLKKNPDLSSDQWIELIPFKETRDYVKAVMEYMLVFERMNPNTPQTTRLSSYLFNTPANVAVVENNCNPLLDWCL